MEQGFFRGGEETTPGRYISKDPILFLGGSTNLYAYVHNNPVNLIDPSGLQDNASPWQLGWEWLAGSGPRQHSFQGGDPFTELLRQHSHIQDVRNDISSRLANCNALGGSAPYNLSGLQGVPKYLKDYSTLLTGGMTGNLAVTFLGSYNLNYTVSNVDWQNGSATVNFQVTNTSTAASGFRPPVIGYTEAWNEYIGKPMNEMFSTGPMSETTQQFNWSEGIKFNPCDCKGK
jgi:uncharacterized protein RhaS with RHS repeats